MGASEGKATGATEEAREGATEGERVSRGEGTGGGAGVGDGDGPIVLASDEVLVGDDVGVLIKGEGVGDIRGAAAVARNDKDWK